MIKHNNKIININGILINNLYKKLENKIIHTNDEACGYSNLLDTVDKIENTNPVLAQKILFLINNTLNDTRSFVQDNDSTNRIIIEAIKTDNLKLLRKTIFNPIRLPTYAIKGIFSTLDKYSMDVKEKIFNNNVYGIGAVMFENVIRWISQFMDDYLMDLGILNDDYTVSIWTDFCVIDDIPNEFNIFHHCSSGDKLYGFHLLYDIWHISRKPNQMTFDILLRFIIIELYLKSVDYFEYDNLLKTSKFKKQIIFKTIPKITIKPAYVPTLDHIKELNDKIYNFNSKLYKETCIK